MSKKAEFKPSWYEGEVPEDSYRSIFKWGDPYQYKHPNQRLYKLMKDTFCLTDEHFKKAIDPGLDKVNFEKTITLTEKQVDYFKETLGEDKVKMDSYSRLSVAYGKTMYDAMRLRKKIVENIPDMVLYPGTKEEIVKIVKYCHEQKIPVYVYGGGSSVTRGVEAIEGGVTIDSRVNLNKVLEFDETNQTIKVQAGITGPDLEKKLQNARKILGAERNYTTGHFPQSYEYSVVGGWVVTRGAGQNSTYYGKIEDIVLSQEYVTPIGEIITLDYPAKATGPDIDQIMMGSEGAYGILVAVTLKLKRWMPENTRRFSYIFKNWQVAQHALREIMQSEAGLPSVCRLSDPEETDVALKLYGVEGTALDTLMKIRGLKKNQRCLFLGTADGSGSYTKMVAKNVARICRKYGALYTTSYVTRRWEHGRFKDPYLREDLQDYGIIIDTLECTVNWSNLEEVYSRVRKYCKSRPRTICMTHMSHVYSQGCNLYFIFIGKFEGIDDFMLYHQGILDAIQVSGATMSHHHGIGKLFAPWLEAQLGKNQYEVFKVLKKHFDPHNIMNPGGTLGLDLKEENKRDIRSLNN